MDDVLRYYGSNYHRLMSLMCPSLVEIQEMKNGCGV